MRIEGVLFFLILFHSCQSFKETGSFIPLKYSFPENEINKGKTFTYLDESNGEKTYYDYYFGDNYGKKCLIVKDYSSDGTGDSIIYVDHKLVESYAHFFSRYKPTKANILLDTTIHNGTRLGKNFLTVQFESDSTLLTIRSESEFLKDTTFNWKGTLLPTLIIKTTYYNTIHGKISDALDYRFQIEFITYLAQKIGRVRTRMLTTKENKLKNIDLIDIQDRHR